MNEQADSILDTIEAALKTARGKLTEFRPEYTITKSDNTTGSIWQPYNLTQPEIDKVDAALAWIREQRQANAELAAAVPVEVRGAMQRIIDAIPVRGFADIGDEIRITRAWLDEQKAKGKIA